MRVILDAFGGDNSHFEIIKGAEMAVNKKSDVKRNNGKRKYKK